MERRNKLKNQILWGFVGAVITVLGLCAIFSFNNVYPFGTEAAIISDAFSQYSDFLLFNAHSSFAEKLYSFSKGVGGPVTGLIAYYTASPFNIIFRFFAPENVEFAFFILIVLKFTAMTEAMYIYFCNHYENNICNISCALAYSFFPQLFRFYFHVMWMDTFIALPLLILFTENIIENKKHGMGAFVALYSLTLISNYYSAYMASLFILIYFFYYCFIRKLNLKDMFSKAIKMAESVVLSAMIASPVLIPTFIQLFNGKMQDRGLINEGASNMYSFGAVISSIMDRGYIYDRLPLMYGSVIVTAIVIIYFLNGSISKRNRIAALAVIALLMFSMYRSEIYYIWHSFAWPMCFHYRFSFVMAFFVVTLCRRRIENIGGKQSVLYLAVFSALYIFVAVCYLKWQYIPWDNLAIKSTFFSVAVISCILVLSIKYRKVSSLAMCAVLIMGSIYNSSASFRSERKVSLLSQIGNGGDYKLRYIEADAALEHINDDTFYRVEDVTARESNQPMGLGYNGVNHFSSTFDTSRKKMFVHFGYSDSFYSLEYRHSHPLSDSIIGIKYLISKDETKVPSEYELIYDGEKSLYYNPYYFPVIYTGETNDIEFNDDWHMHMNNMSQRFTGKDISDENGNAIAENMAELSHKLQSSAADITLQDGGNIELTANGKYLLTSIIYDEDWHIKVNGKEVKPERYMEHFISVPLEEGECSVTMKYIPKGLVTGAVLFVVALVIITVSMYIKRKKLERKHE